jgi:hypothetical protein
MRLVLWFASASAFTLACSGTDAEIDANFDTDGAAGTGVGVGGGETDSGGAGSAAAAGSAGIGGASGMAPPSGGQRAGAARFGRVGGSLMTGGSGGTRLRRPIPSSPRDGDHQTSVATNTKSDVQAGSTVATCSGQVGPKFIGWQEIGADDPCGGTCEIDAIHTRFASANGWTTHRPTGKRPDGGTEVVKVPITSKAGVRRARGVSPGWAGGARLL